MRAARGPRASGPAGLGATATLRPALVVITVAAVLCVIFELILLRDQNPDLVEVAGLLALAGLVYVVAGALAWDRRPSNRLGLWLVGIGYMIIIARLSLVADPVLATTGLILAQTPIAGVVALVLLFPSGRLRGRLDRWLVIVAVVITVGIAVPTSLFRPADPSTALRIGDAPQLVAILTITQIVAWWLLIAVVVARLVWRLRTERAVRGERTARIAVSATGLASVLLLPLVGQLGLLLGWNELAVFGVQVALVAAVPVVFATALLAGGFGRTGRLEELAAWLGRPGSAPGGVDPGTVRDALAATLGDATLELLFRPDSSRGLVDAAGRPAGEPDVRSPSGAVTVPLRGDAAAVIVYDTAAVPDPELVSTAGRVVAVGLDRDRVTAELLAEREELRRSRNRVVAAADTERRRLAADLHDGLQSRLVLAAIRAGTLAAVLAEPDRASVAGLRVDLEDAVTELRRLVHGLVPALLLERGLAPAVRELVDRCGLPVRLEVPDRPLALPPAVATSAYFVVAEAVTNAVKHAAATRLTVTLAAYGPTGLRLEVRDDGVGGGEPPDRSGATGVGLQGMADRVEALDGTFAFRSTPGAGSTVLAIFPGEPSATEPIIGRVTA